MKAQIIHTPLTTPTTETPLAGGSPSLSPHLQVGGEAPSLFILLLWGWVDPDEAIVAKDDRCPTGQVVEVSLLAFHKGGRDLDEHTLAKLQGTPRDSAGETGAPTDGSEALPRSPLLP